MRENLCRDAKKFGIWRRFKRTVEHTFFFFTRVYALLRRISDD